MLNFLKSAKFIRKAKKEDKSQFYFLDLPKNVKIAKHIKNFNNVKNAKISEKDKENVIN